MATFKYPLEFDVIVVGAGHAGWAAAAGPQGGGAAADAWSPAGAYLRHDQVVASDGAIYVAAADGGEGQDPATDAASAHWRRVAATSVTFRDWGAVAP